MERDFFGLGLFFGLKLFSILFYIELVNENWQNSIKH